MDTKMATVHFSMCQRVLHCHGEREYLLARLPFVVMQDGEYPRTYEVMVKEWLDSTLDVRAVEIVLDPRDSIPLSVDRLREMAIDFYRAALPTSDREIGTEVDRHPRGFQRSYVV
jgi:hypothetical protein